jgi:predicted solute-binding protein
VKKPVRLGAVNYLNVRPLIYGLDHLPARVSLRFDPPSVCARLLDEGAIDLGMVPSITYLDRPDDRIVPGVCIGSEGPVQSVALFSRRPPRQIRSIALDTSSCTSAALVRILCRRAFDIDPVFVPHEPDLASMLATSDAALLIGDASLFADPAVYQASKHDLGALWTDMTHLPFVWAFWSGSPGSADDDTVALLQSSAEQGMARTDEIAAAYCAAAPDRIPLAGRYLRESLMFRFDARAMAGLRVYYREAAAAGVVADVRHPLFFEPSGTADNMVPAVGQPG